jgi:hypothetical protein
MQDVSRHKSPDVLAGYVPDAQAFTDHTGEDFASGGGRLEGTAGPSRGEMAEPKSFLLRYVGARFEGTRLPLDVLGDLPAFRDLLVSYADAEWRKAHPDRERLPRNFEKGLLFDLVGIEDGSAMPRIEASLSASRNRIASLTLLEDGWHDGRGRAPTAKAAAASLRLLSRKPEMADGYSIFPTDDGGLLFEFVRQGWNHSIEIGPAGKAEIYSSEIVGDGEADVEAFDVESDEFIEEFDQVTGTRT